jgi:hypothetical protein
LRARKEERAAGAGITAGATELHGRQPLSKRIRPLAIESRR